MSSKNGHLDAVTQELHQLPVPMGWVRTTIDDLGEVRLGRQRSPKNRSKDHPTKYLRAANITWNGIDLNDVLDMEFQPSELETYRLKAGDVLLSEASGSAAEVGKPALWSGEIDDCCFQNTVIRFRPSEAVQPRYAHLAFLHFARNRVFSQVAKGVGIHHLSADRFSAIPFLLPPVAEQKRIVVRADELLTELDAGIAALKRIQSNLKRYRASVLKAAVEGKLTEEWRAEHRHVEPASELIARVPPPPLPNRYKTRSKDLLFGHPALAVGNPQSQLPEGWMWTPLVDIARMESGHTPSRNHPEWWDGDIPWIGIADAREHDGGSIGETIQYTNKEGLANSAARLLPEQTVCISRTASVGYVVVMQRPMATSQDFVNWVPTDAVLSGWLKIVFMADRDALRSFGKGSVHKTIYFPEWLSMHIALPPLREQAEIILQVESHLSGSEVSQSIAEQNLLRAARLRQSILKDAFEGRLVAQNSADEPASELLARIKAARQPVVQKSASTTPQRRVPKEITHRRAAVVAYMISHIGQNGSTATAADSLGRTKLVKALYIAQTHEELDLQFRFQRYAAGPFDEALFKLEGTAKKNEWFVTKDRDNFGVTYHAAPKTEPMSQQAAKFLGDNQTSFDRLLGHIATMDMQQAELFATAYAAWNDLLIDGREITDDAIIDEFYAWDESKQKFSRNAILKQLKWMRSEGYIPSGKGERTQPRDKKTKLPSSKKKRRKA